VRKGFAIPGDHDLNDREAAARELEAELPKSI
jgi:hypothetical protein